jgi:hypothetical protein
MPGRFVDGTARALVLCMQNTTPDDASTPTAEIAVADHIENSTDATRGEPLATRAEKRKLELQAALEGLGVGEPARKDIELAIASIEALLTGESAQLSNATAVQLSRVLERSKHLGETAQAQP